MFFTTTADKYKYKVYNVFVSILIITSAVGIGSCKYKRTARQTVPAFYYWKSVFKLSGFEKKYLDSLGIKTIYIKFFDVGWEEASKQPQPKAKIIFADTSYKKYNIIPTVFITNECIQKTDSSGILYLADNIIALIKNTDSANNITAVKEIQIDCDWTAATKDNYFALLKRIKQSVNTSISATIRLHQVKFITKAGVPPVDKGLLMCYNMGNLKNPATQNSIIETEELKKYTSTLSLYPLPLDIALPLFGWKVLFRNNVYKGLIENLPDSILSNTVVSKKTNRYTLLKDTALSGYSLQKGDILRNEQSTYTEILSTAGEVNSHLKNSAPHVVLYHLDSVILKKHSLHELENIFNSMH
jgi:hypothetical protein